MNITRADYGEREEGSIQTGPTQDDEEGRDKRISTSTRQHSTTQHNTTQSFPRPGVNCQKRFRTKLATLPHLVRPTSLSLSISKRSDLQGQNTNTGRVSWCPYQASRLSFPSRVGVISPIEASGSSRITINGSTVCCFLVDGLHERPGPMHGVPYEARCLELCRIRRNL